MNSDLEIRKKLLPKTSTIGFTLGFSFRKLQENAVILISPE